MSKQIELFDTFPIKISEVKDSKKSTFSDSKKKSKKGYSLVCEVDATHSGTLINNRVYPPAAMQKGIQSWTTPYKKPVLVNHDETQDPIGRVLSARYFKTERGMKSFDAYEPILRESEGYGYQRLTIKVTDPEAIKKILDGRYETVSVRMTTTNAICSICGQDWSGEDGVCEHRPGTKYDGKLAYITTGDLSYRELSFVNIPADEYAGVKEAVVSEQRDALDVSLYANNDSEKVLEDLRTGENLYALLDSEAEESDDVVAYLLDKSQKTKLMNKEDDVKLSELTKDQLKELEPVKELIAEAVDSIQKNCEDAAKACEEKLQKVKDEYEAALEAAKKTSEDSKEEKEEESAEDKKKEKKEEVKEEEKEEEKEEDDEDKKKKKKAGKKDESCPSPEGKGKCGGSKSGTGNQGPVGEDPGDSSDELKTLKDENQRILDENVKINAELHKMVAERLYDLKKSLRKPDVVGITTPDARNAKIEELAQRSIDSLKDQISDLLVEQSSAHVTGTDGKGVENPSISRSDMTNEVLEDKKKIKEGKMETLTRLFPKAK